MVLQSERETIRPGHNFEGNKSIDVYLDYNATTPTDPQVREVLMEYLGAGFGNASSPHRRGKMAAAAVEKAERRLSNLLGCTPNDIIWTSGATEGANTVLKGLALANQSERRKIVVSSGEHKAVLDASEWVRDYCNLKVELAPLTQSGSVDIASLRGLVDGETLLVAVMAANNETGVLNDVRAVADISHHSGALFLCDATQQVGKLPLETIDIGMDFAVISAHKFYGPQGVGAIVAPARNRALLTPLIHGGGHQGGVRSGTLNVPGIAGTGLAAEIAYHALEGGETGTIGDLRDNFEAQLIDSIADTTIHGKSTSRLPNTISIQIAGVDSEALVVGCHDVSIATGSACTSAVPTPSHVLTSMGLSADAANETVRISLGRFTTENEIDFAVGRIVNEARRIRGLAR